MVVTIPIMRVITTAVILITGTVTTETGMEAPTITADHIHRKANRILRTISEVHTQEHLPADWVLRTEQL